MKKNKLLTPFFNLSPLQIAFQDLERKRRIFFCILILALVQFGTLNVSAQYLHASGIQILDKNNQPIILRGMGLGGWMIQEGYMLETKFGTQHEIKAAIEKLIGTANTDEFYNKWLANHCTKRDIDSLASWGFNSVRLPMHYNLYTLPVESDPKQPGDNTWLDKGFAMTDSLLKWCTANNMYLILDLHAAPGGQGNDLNISDRDPSKPSLWDSEANKLKTIALWKKLADRYKNEPWIGGYDLVNEPNWKFTGSNNNGCDESLNAPIRDLYVRIIAAIRTVDPNHMVFIEGNCWGNNHNGILSPKLDNNLVISFHKYWNNNTQETIQGLLNLRNSTNAPLWIGESGENSDSWFTGAIKLAESNGIGWAWWPLKKINSIVNPLTVVKTNEYNNLLQFWQGGGTTPAGSVTATYAKDAVMQIAENLKIENCIYRKDVIDAMFRQVKTDETIPFGTNKVPGIIHASDFDLGHYNKAYYDTDTSTLHVSVGGTFKIWNMGGAYRNEGVDIETNADTDPNANHYNIGWTADKEWMMYTLNVDSSATYDVKIHYSTINSNTVVRFNINGLDQTTSIPLPSTGGWGNTTIHDIVLYEGAQKFKFMFEKGGANLGYLEFTLSKKLSETSFLASAASTAAQGSVVYISLNKYADETSISATGLSATVNGNPATITDAHLDETNSNKLVVTIDQTIYDSDIIKISYSGNTIKATDESLLENFTDLLATNNLPYHYALPCQIETENFLENHGLQLESCSDAGGGQDVGYTDVGDYLIYRIFVAEGGEYKVDGRIAANDQTGALEFQQLSSEGAILNKVVLDIPVTGGWQNWQTASTKMTFTAGHGFLKVKINKAGLNMNWFKFTQVVIDGIKDDRQGSLNVYPNPTDSHLTIEVPGQYNKENVLSIRSATGSLLKHNERLSNQALKKFYVGDLPAGLYILEFSMGDKIWQNKFIIQ
jgi:endoglucanase